MNLQLIKMRCSGQADGRTHSRVIVVGGKERGGDEKGEENERGHDHEAIIIVVATAAAAAIIIIICRSQRLELLFCYCCCCRRHLHLLFLLTGDREEATLSLTRYFACHLNASQMMGQQLRTAWHASSCGFLTCRPSGHVHLFTRTLFFLLIPLPLRFFFLTPQAPQTKRR